MIQTGDYIRCISSRDNDGRDEEAGELKIEKRKICVIVAAGRIEEIVGKIVTRKKITRESPTLDKLRKT